jgi:hypothetical protein
MDEIGTYVLEAFYENDIALYRSQSPSKHVSLRMLVERCGTIDLPISATFLSTSIRMAVVARALPRDASFSRLPVSHRVELLRLPPDEIEPFAADALRARLPVRELRTKVRTLLVASRGARRRRDASPLVRISKSLVRALEGGESVGFDVADVARLSTAERASLREAAHRAKEILSRLSELVADD